MDRRAFLKDVQSPLWAINDRAAQGFLRGKRPPINGPADGYSSLLEGGDEAALGSGNGGGKGGGGGSGNGKGDEGNGNGGKGDEGEGNGGGSGSLRAKHGSAGGDIADSEMDTDSASGAGSKMKGITRGTGSAG
eukprot:12090308-Alexandrium_andersonii.AAC.1